MKREVSIQIGPKGGLMSTLVYLGIGLLLFLWLGDYTVFTWADPWVYIWAVFWPFVVIWYFFLWALAFAAIVLVILAFAYLWDNR